MSSLAGNHWFLNPGLIVASPGEAYNRDKELQSNCQVAGLGKGKFDFRVKKMERPGDLFLISENQKSEHIIH